MKGKITPSGRANKIFGAFGADPFPQNLKMEKDGFENFGGSGGGEGGLEFEQASPLGHARWPNIRAVSSVHPRTWLLLLQAFG